MDQSYMISIIDIATTIVELKSHHFLFQSPLGSGIWYWEEERVSKGTEKPTQDDAGMPERD